MRDMHSSNTGLSGKILLWGQISPIILFAGRGGNKESNSVRIHFPHFIPLTVNARSLGLVWPRFTANRSVRADWKLSLILSGVCYSCRCSLAGSQSVRPGRGLQSAFCVSHGHTQYGLKKKNDSQTCSGHKTAQSKVQLWLECFNNDEQGDKETSSPSRVSLTPNSWLFVQVVFSGVERGKKMVFSNRGVSQRVTLCAWPRWCWGVTHTTLGTTPPHKL